MINSLYLSYRTLGRLLRSQAGIWHGICSNSSLAASTLHDVPRSGGASMANPLQLRMLCADVDKWNQWRAQNPAVRVDLRGGDLTQSDLRLVNLREADLREVMLVLANLSGADLRGADLRNANLVGARMIGADIADTDLRGADLRTAEDLTPEQIFGTRGDRSTILPEPLQHPDHWPSS